MLTAMSVQDFQSPTAASTLTGPQESKTTIFSKGVHCKKSVPRSTNIDFKKWGHPHQGKQQFVPWGLKHRLHQKKSTAKQICLEGPQHRLHTNESTRNKGNKTCASRSKKIDFTIGEHRKTKSASRSKTTTLSTREHPPEGKERTTKDRKESSDTEGQKAQFTQNPQTKPHTVNKVIKKNQKISKNLKSQKSKISKKSKLSKKIQISKKIHI